MRLEEVEQEEDTIVGKGGKLTGSMIGRRRVATTWAIGEAWERFCRERREVVQRAFRVVGLSLPLDGSSDNELSIKGIETDFLVEKLVDWKQGGNTTSDDDSDDGKSVEALVEEDKENVTFE